MGNPFYRPNAAPQPRPESAAQRRLKGVGCRRWFGSSVAPIVELVAESPSLYDPVCPLEHLWRDRDANLLRRLEVDDELGAHDDLERQVGGLRPLDNPVHVGRQAPRRLGDPGAIAEQPPCVRQAPRKQGGQPLLRRQLGNAFAMDYRRGQFQDQERVGVLSPYGLEDCLQIRASPSNRETLRLQTQCTCLLCMPL